MLFRSNELNKCKEESKKYKEELVKCTEELNKLKQEFNRQCTVIQNAESKGIKGKDETLFLTDMRDGIEMERNDELAILNVNIAVEVLDINEQGLQTKLGELQTELTNSISQIEDIANKLKLSIGENDKLKIILEGNESKLKVISKEHDELNDKLKVFENNNNEIKEKYDIITKENELLNKKIEELTKEKSKLEDIKKESTETDKNELYMELKTRCETLEQAKNVINLRNSELESKLKTLKQKQLDDNSIKLRYLKASEEIERYKTELCRREEKLSTLNEELKKESTNEQEMRNEMSILIKHYKIMQATLKSNEAKISKQKKELEIVAVSLQEKEDEINKKKNHIEKLYRQLETKKNQIHSAQTRIKELTKEQNFTINSKLVMKNKEIESLKDLISNYQLELETKNKGISKLKNKISHLKRTKDMQSKFITTFADMENEEQMKEIKEIEEIDQNNISEEDEQEISMENSDNSFGNLPLFPRIQLKANNINKKEIPIELRKKYMKRYNSYMKSLKEREVHNNSSNIRDLLSHNISYVPSPESGRFNIKDNFELNVNDIIKNSLSPSVIISKRPDRGRPLNIRITNEPPSSLIVHTPMIKRVNRTFK